MPHEVRVRKLRVRSVTSNRVALRLDVEQRLRDMPLAPASLPSSAIVIIRRVVATGGGRDWPQDAAAQVKVIAARAARPARDYVPHDADSVLFWDAVELLTCYTQDVLAGRERWYWRDLFSAMPADPVGTQLAAAWQQYPAAVPRLMTTFPPAQTRRAVQLLGARDLAAIVRVLHDAFDLPDDVFAAQRPEPAAGAVQAATTAPPWDRWLPPDIDAGLPPPAAYLLGLCHTLDRQPQIARNPAFARSAARWLEAAPDRARADPAADTTGRRSPDVDIEAADTDTAATDALPAPAEVELNVTAVIEPSAPGVDHPTTDEAGRTRAPAGIESRLGGVFYLVNAVDALASALLSGAVDDVNRWELVAALAWQLLGDSAAAYRADAVWPLLRDLAQCEPDAPLGALLPQPDAFCVAPDWFRQWGVDRVTEPLVCRAEHAAGRLRLWAEDARILLVDVPDQGGALDAVIAHFAAAGLTLRLVDGKIPVNPYPAPHGDVESPSLPLTPGLAWWVGCVHPLLDFWMWLALAGTRSTWHSDQWRDHLAVLAVIQVTQTHIDVYLPLDAIDGDMRRAGLDANPGWVPAYGAIIAFYFD